MSASDLIAGKPVHKSSRLNRIAGFWHRLVVQIKNPKAVIQRMSAKSRKL
ncbi:hypothetical protein NC99_25430 [Sunxiuqinia dokdonensis]|uniref:Uncharacterized protein n=1 Tax=Sunxiuqinia dokdonensis TaxID=1409788 RepID=A0A0L8V854_9BACT|nr:hypothetical protein NC99_25430 [Sunxiuqinia dokdonensis]